MLWQVRSLSQTSRKTKRIICDGYGQGSANNASLLICIQAQSSTPGHISLTLYSPWSTVLLMKLIGLQLVKKFPAFHGTWKFITALTSFRQLSLSWASSIQSKTPHPTYWRSILILSSRLRLCLPSGLFPSGFPTNTLYVSVLSSTPGRIISIKNSDEAIRNRTRDLLKCNRSKYFPRMP